MSKKNQAVRTAKELLNDPSFKAEHRISPKFFTRDRKLTFIIVVLLILQKSLKSSQSVLNEFFGKPAAYPVIVTASAFTQARLKLSHTAFIELNRKAIAVAYYKDGVYKKWRGFRTLAVDGFRITLPNEEEIRKFFGVIKIACQDKNVTGEYPVAIASVLYDVLNGIAIDAILGHAKAYEVNLATEHLESARSGDLLTFDRNYPSYRFSATLMLQGIEFAGRCSKSSFRDARMMFKTDIKESKTVIIRPHHTKIKEIKALGQPVEIKVRSVRIILDSGETVVQVTSLTDENLYTVSDLKELYHLRQGIETFYGTVKGRLNLENFTGKSVEAVRQDFYSTVFVSGLESILIEDAQESPDTKSSNNKYPQTVNKAVSFNTIKNHVLDLFLKEDDFEILSDKLTRLFMTNPVCVRERKVPRNKSRPGKLVSYHKRIKKICF